MKINENIRNFRLFRNMSQAELAEQLSKSKSVISHWESGENSPDLDSCEKLCRILNVTPNQLFGWETNEEYVKHIQRLQLYSQKINELRAKIDEAQKEIDRYEGLKTNESLYDMPFVDDEVN